MDYKIHAETDRLILRNLELEDVDGMYALDSDPEVHRYLGNNPIQTKQEALDIIKHVQKQYVKNGFGRWAVVDKKTNEFLGWSGLKFEQEFRKDLEYYDLGYRFRREYWGMGIASETAFASIKYGFEVLNLPMICGTAHVENIASNKILKKVGLKSIDQFEYEGSLCNWYELKKEDWLKIKSMNC